VIWNELYHFEKISPFPDIWKAILYSLAKERPSLRFSPGARETDNLLHHNKQGSF